MSSTWCHAQVILSFVDNWQATGGVDQFVKWSGSTITHQQFFSDGNCMQLYKNTVAAIVNRVNSINGRTCALSPLSPAHRRRKKSCERASVCADWPQRCRHVRMHIMLPFATEFLHNSASILAGGLLAVQVQG